MKSLSIAIAACGASMLWCGCAGKAWRRRSRWPEASSAGRSRSIRRCRDTDTKDDRPFATVNGRDGNGVRLEVKTIAVIGADAVGCGIASIAAQSGYDTVLEDVSDERLAKAAAWIARKHESFV